MFFLSLKCLEGIHYIKQYLQYYLYLLCSLRADATTWVYFTYISSNIRKL